MTKPSPTVILREARRRRVFHTAAIYIVGAFVALQVADLAFPGLSIPDTAIKYIWIGAILGFPFAVFFGWRFDLVNGRILRTAAVDGAPGLPIGKGDKLTLSIMSVALAALCVGLAFEISQTPGEVAERPKLVDAAPNSVAVLPFANFGGAPENEYLADGISETLLHALAQASGLKVTARTSSFYYKDKDVDVREIAAELGVSNVLEGSVQQSGDKIRIVAQLIEADTGFHLWSNTYDSVLGDVFAIQDSIASNVAMAILATVTAAPGVSGSRLTGVSTTNFEAYQKYLQGLEQLRISSNISLPKADVLFQQALAIDPDFFDARRELAYSVLHMLGNGTISRADALDRLGPLRDKLLEERPTDGMALVTDAKFRSRQDRESIDFEELVPKLVAAIEREPNETRIYSYLAQVLATLDRHEEAVEWVKRAIIIDPLDYELYYNLGFLFRSLGDSKAYVEALERVTEINPEWPSGHARMGWAKFFETGDYVGWYQAMMRAAALDPLDHEMEVGLAQGLLRLGLYEESAKHAARADRINTANGGEYSVRPLLSLRGDLEESRRLTESLLRREWSERGSGNLFPAVCYMSASIDVGKVQEALAVFEAILPGVTSAEFTPASTNDWYFQHAATVGWAYGKDVSTVSARLDALAPHPLWESGTFGVSTAFLRGDLEEASRLAIENLTIDTLFYYQYIYPLKIVAEHPVAAAKMAALEEEVLHRGAEVRAYIAAQESDR